MSGKSRRLIRDGCHHCTREFMDNIRVPPGKTEHVGEVSVENKTGNSIMVRYDDQRKTVLLVDCCLEEQGK